MTYSTAFGFFGRDAYAYVALEKGFFEEAGFDVEIVPGTGSVNNIRSVAAGQLDYAPADVTTTVVTRANEDIPVKVVAIVQQRVLTSILALAESGIREPTDLAGRSIAEPAGSAGQVLFPLYAERAGLDPDSVTFIASDPATLPSLLASGQVDAVGQFIVGVPLFERAAEGREIIALPYADLMPELLGLGIIVSEERLEERPDEVARFVQALMRGLEYSIEHPDEMAEILVQHQPEADAEIAELEMRAMAEFVQTEVTEENCVGYVEESLIQSTIDIVLELYDVEGGVEPEDIFEPDLVCP